MALSRPSYELTHGPDRSHDALESERFDRLGDAVKARESLLADRCWRILRFSGGQNYTQHEVTTVDIGGPDEDRRKERERFAEQYRTA